MAKDNLDQWKWTGVEHKNLLSYVRCLAGGAARPHSVFHGVGTSYHSGLNKFTLPQ